MTGDRMTDKEREAAMERYIRQIEQVRANAQLVVAGLEEAERQARQLRRVK